MPDLGFPPVPATIPMSSGHDFVLMRCTTCGALVPGMWQITRKTMAAGVDHVLDVHRADLIAGVLTAPLFINCAIQDPFWFDEHAGVAGHA
jgi:hypothetical protein